MQSPCKDCTFKKKDKNKFPSCVQCKRVAQFVELMEMENPFPVLGDNTPQVHRTPNNYQEDIWGW